MAGAEFKLMDAIDENIVRKLKSIGEQAEVTAASYEKLVVQIGKMTGFNPRGLEELQQKAAKYNETAQQLRDTQSELNRLRQEQEELLKKVATLMSELAKTTREEAKANEENATATGKSAKSINDSVSALEKIRNIKTNYSDKIQQISKYMIELDRLQRNEKALATQLKSGLITREQYNQRLTEGKIAQKEYKDAISATTKEIANSRKEETQLEGSLVSLRAQLSNLTKEYDNLSRTDRMGERGKQLKQSIQGIQTELKEAENATGRFQREVGSYEKAIESAMSKNLPYISQIKAMVESAGGLEASLKAAGVAAANFGKQMLVLLANPIVATVAALVAAYIALKSAMESVTNTARSNEEQNSKLNAAMSPLTVIGDRVTRTMEKLADVYIKVAGSVMEAVASFTDWLGITEGLAEESAKYAKYEEKLLQLAVDRRTVNEENAVSEAKISELRSKTYEKDMYSAEERLSFIREAQKEEKIVYERNLSLAQRELALLKELGERTKNDAALNDKISQARINLTNVTTRYHNSLRFLNRMEQTLVNESKKTLDVTKEKIDVEKELEETRLVLIKSEREREIKEIQKTINDKLILIKGNTEKEIELRKNLMEVLRQKVSEINNKYDQEEAKQAEESAKKRMEEQSKIYAETSTFYTFLLQDELTKNAELYKKGEIDRTEYEKRKLKLTEDYGIEQAKMALELLEDQMEIEGLSEEERTKLKEKLTAARIALSEKERESVEKSLDAQEKKRQESIKKIKDSFNEFERMADSTVPGLGKVFSGITDIFEKMAEKQKVAVEDILTSAANIAQGVSQVIGGFYNGMIEQLEVQEKANDDAEDRELERIENLAQTGAISEEEAEARKRAASAKTEKQNDEIARKRAQLQTKQAKLEKSANIVSTIMNTAVAIMKAWSQGGIFAAPMAAMIAAMGAVQLSTIVAQPIPKYAKGTKSHKGGLAWVGDGGEHETVITKKGMYITPDTPTLIDLPKGAKVLPYALDLETIKGNISDIESLIEYRKENNLPPININNDYKGLEKRLDALEDSQRKELRAILRAIKGKDYKQFGAMV